ncbi:MAG: hypothetical protein V7L31_23130 [Nostoc sp.]|uniref:hypothetical protein n=1 Tax=Nostoc sp. TaxID=1180 RepID=UPI002FF2E3FD
MGYFPDPFNSLSRNTSNAIHAIEENAKRADDARKFITDKALQQIAQFSPIQLYVDPCNLVISVNGASVTIRNPACNTSNPPPVIPTSPTHGDPNPKQPARCARGVQVLCKALIESLVINGDKSYHSTFTVKPTKSLFPTSDNTFFPNLPDVRADFTIDVTGKYVEDFNFAYIQRGDLNPATQRSAYILRGGQVSGDNFHFQQTIEYRIYYNTSTHQIYPQILSNDKPNAGNIPDPGITLKLTNAADYNALTSNINVFNYDTLPNVNRETNVFQLLFVCDSTNYVDPPDPPKPPKPKPCECMCSDDLLKLVLKRIGNLPATVPTNIADTTDKTTKTLESLAEMIFWHVKQMDAISGEYPIPLTIKADPTNKDSKDTKLELPNIAETLAEILGLLIATKRDSHAGLVAGISALTEAGMIKNLATQTYDIAQANAEYLGYKLDQTKRTIPCTFTPNANSISETLKPSNVDIVSYINNDKVDLQDEIKKLTTMAERWNAQNWRNLGTTAKDVTAALQKNLITSPQATANVSNAVKEETFQQFLSEVQQGFVATPGVTDVADPWGDNPLDAPLVRQIGIIDPNETPPAQVTPQQQKQNDNLKVVTNIANLLNRL